MPIKMVLSDQRVPVKIWTDTVEAQALSQLRNAARLPFVFKHVAAMPDVHLGIGATVGSVIATKGAICPAAVGVDIGCGMMAVRTNLTASQLPDSLEGLRHSIERSIPLGFEHNKELSVTVENHEIWATMPERFQPSWKKIQSQLGSLGGGNHFIEVCLDTEGRVWVMLHSGSRNIGKTTAEYHIRQAKDVMKRMFIDLPDPDLAYFAVGTDDFKEYTDELKWCQQYASANRHEMMARVLHDLSHALGLSGEPVPFDNVVNCHHNYVAWENHFGENVMVTRKGAVRARTGDLGIIPGSMGTRSYIVEGLGCDDSFHSCSHGAGRRMSRTAARKNFTVADLEAQTQGVVCRKDDGVLDEIPGAYKPIEEVMANQNDLVKVLFELKQVLCVKG